MSDFFNRAVRLWFALSLVSVAIDVACYWLAQSRAPLPGDGGLDYIAIFLVSAPAPFLIAIAIVLLGGLLALVRGLWLGFAGVLHWARRKRDYAAAPGMGLAPGHKS